MFLLENIVVAAKTFSCFHTKEPRIVCCIEKIRRKSTYSFETAKFTQTSPSFLCNTGTQSYELDPHTSSPGTLHITRVTPGHQGEGALTSEHSPLEITLLRLIVPWHKSHLSSQKERAEHCVLERGNHKILSRKTQSKQYLSLVRMLHLSRWHQCQCHRLHWLIVWPCVVSVQTIPGADTTHCHIPSKSPLMLSAQSSLSISGAHIASGPSSPWGAAPRDQHAMGL